MKLFKKISIAIIFIVLALFGFQIILLAIDSGLSEVIKSLLEAGN